MDEDDDDLTIEITDEDEADEVEPTPWHNSDTVAASFMFASHMAAAVSAHFANMSMIALGQAGHEWQQSERNQFVREAKIELDQIVKRTDGGAEGGGVNG